MPGTDYLVVKTSAVKVAFTDDSDNAVFIVASTSPSSAAGYAKGCIMLDSTNGIQYTNTGSATSATWTATGSQS